MTIRVIAVGQMKEKHYRAAAEEYVKRLSRYDRIEIIEIPDMPEPPRASEAALQKIAMQEGEKILEAIRSGDYVIALCIGGKQYSSEGLAEKIADMRLRAARPVFVIGASNGLGENVLGRADERLSFSPMTFPHQLARVMLLEQLYRACKINANERYHK